MDERSTATVSDVSFDTPLGVCRIAWSALGITRIELPGTDGSPALAAASTRLTMPPEHVRDAVRRITIHLHGNPQDLQNLSIDMDGIAPFFRRVYEAARAIAPGKTVSYAELAELAGSPRAFRAVGQALAKNPFPIVVPCHRVLAAGGKPGGFSAPGGVATKMRLLEIERRSKRMPEGPLFAGTS